MEDMRIELANFLFVISYMSYDITKIIYVKEDPVDAENVATFVIDTSNWKQPQTDDDIVRITTFIANIATQTLLKSQRHGANKFDVLVYMENFKVGNLNYKFVKYLADILKSLFPEKLRKATLIDPPKIFITSYEIVKTFLDKPTRKKVELISTKENKQIYVDVIED
jgi:hypothetical protein